MLNVVVRCLTADGWILGSAAAELDAVDGKAYPTRKVVVPISAPGRVEGIVAYVPSLDVSVPLPMLDGARDVDRDQTVTLDFGGGPMIHWRLIA